MTGLPINGIIPPLITPLTPDNKLDIKGLKTVVEQQIAAGVDALFVLGSTGEVAYFDDNQRVEIVETVLEIVNGRVPILVGCIEFSWRRVLQQAKLLTREGVAALVATSPIYALNSPQEVANHFRAIKEGIDLPLVAYNVPVRTQTKLCNDVLIQLGKEQVLAGVKDSSGDDVSFRRLILLNRECGSPLKLFTGHEVVCDEQLFAGADGIVPGLGNVDPYGYVRMWRAAQARDWEQARVEQDKLSTLMEIAFRAPGRSPDAAGVGGFKTAMAYLGIIDSPTMASPVGLFDEKQKAAVCEVVDRWKAL